MIAIDASGLQGHIRLFAQGVLGHLKGYVERLPYIAQAYIGNEMANIGTDAVFNPGQKLGIRTGAELRSLIPNNPYNLFNASFTEDGVIVHLGTSYPGALGNEDGQPTFIASKGKMEKWFWAQYIRTKKEEYKIIALAVKKRGGIYRKARPAFGPGVDRFMSQGLPQLQQELMTMIIQTWMATIGS